MKTQTKDPKKNKLKDLPAGKKAKAVKGGAAKDVKVFLLGTK
jgi:hypothetical protein